MLRFQLYGKFACSLEKEHFALHLRYTLARMHTRAKMRNGKSRNRVKTEKKRSNRGAERMQRHMKSVTCDVECGSECQHY